MTDIVVSMGEPMMKKKKMMGGKPEIESGDTEELKEYLPMLKEFIKKMEAVYGEKKPEKEETEETEETEDEKEAV